MEDVHEEACRWEHVMSDAVERRLVELLHGPRFSPFGNPIPGLSELDPALVDQAAESEELLTLHEASERGGGEPTSWVIRRIAEPVQVDAALMSSLRAAGVGPGVQVEIQGSQSGGLEGPVQVSRVDGSVQIPREAAAHIFVSPG